MDFNWSVVSTISSTIATLGLLFATYKVAIWTKASTGSIKTQEDIAQKQLELLNKQETLAAKRLDGIRRQLIWELDQNLMQWSNVIEPDQMMTFISSVWKSFREEPLFNDDVKVIAQIHFYYEEIFNQAENHTKEEVNKMPLLGGPFGFTKVAEALDYLTPLLAIWHNTYHIELTRTGISCAKDLKISIKGSGS